MTTRLGPAAVRGASPRSAGGPMACLPSMQLPRVHRRSTSCAERSGPKPLRHHAIRRKRSLCRSAHGRRCGFSWQLPEAAL